MATILDLPTELLDLILELVVKRVALSERLESSRYAVTYSMRSTCRELHARVQPPEVAESTSTQEANESHNYAHEQSLSHLAELFRMEGWSCYTTHPPCSNPRTEVLTKDKYSQTFSMDFPARASDPALSSFPQSMVARHDEPWRDRIPPRSMHACTHCLRLKPSENFAISQLTSSRTTPGWDGLSTFANLKYVFMKIHQICIRCQIKKGTYNEKTPVLRYITNWEGKGQIRTGIVCKRCRKFVDADPQSQTALARKCDQCRAYRPRNHLESPPVMRLAAA